MRLTGLAEEVAPAWELFSLLDGLHLWLEGAAPTIQRTVQHQAVSVYLLYRDVGCLPDDLCGLFGRSMAQISHTWPLSAFGTAENQETVRLTAQAEAGGVLMLQQNLSGRPARVMQTLCLQVDCADHDTAALLVRLLTATDWDSGVTALSSWQDADYLTGQELLLPPACQGHFCYASVRPEVRPRDQLAALDFGQKILLWTAFLKDGFAPAEFSWMSDAIAEGVLDRRLEWELALWEALDQLGFQMVNGEKTFTLFDSEGHRVYFGADGGNAAQRAFLKILFPLNS